MGLLDVTHRKLTRMCRAAVREQQLLRVYFIECFSIKWAISISALRTVSVLATGSQWGQSRAKFWVLPLAEHKKHSIN